MRMIDPADIAAEQARQNLLLLAWFSPAFPIGGFAFSHGLEWAAECGALTNRADLEAWLVDLLAHGSGRTDVILIAAAYRAASIGDEAYLRTIADLGTALQPSRERHLEASVQGQAFLSIVNAAYGEVAKAAPPGDNLTLPFAVGLCGAAHRVALPALLTAYLSSFVANLVSAAVRLGIVGQTDGQRVIAALHPAIRAAVTAGETAGLENLGAATLRADLFSMQHETQYSRLFRS